MNKKSFVFLLLFGAVLLNSIDIPPLKGFVNDYAGFISAETEAVLTAKLKSLEESDSTQIFILTIPSLDGMDIESYSIKVAETWKPGQKKLDNGVLFIVSQNDRKMRIEVGYGLEGVLTDLLSGRIINNVASPLFRDGLYDEGFVAVTDALISIVKNEYQANDALKSEKVTSKSGDGRIIGLLIALFFIVKLIGSASKKAGAASGAIMGAGIPLLIGAFNPVLMIVLGLIGLGMAFIPMSVVYFVLLSGTRGGSSGSSSGGGFSGGGGGGFGGGGASGGW
ncbi:MAG: hypothetical protein A2015_14790 [Spirochaetes bacterium GWF1_31_7]|nr:MAG: hypothetical protein A2Y30_12050 [Spirochaetes bacterium GWE1_32_154]OHD49415.1 MAG: hypothetical protein A2015_14790 [Spirochaetes bacterium GWF1_31_7]OHD51564.1 MAG: hypothetical protein A2Y29_15390 [Spirochaetes bacterium GWE2_31_10]HBD93610.1 hypothetical protein [Spirochaetia bacterium]HBI37996.1 hypothetical protein [Spirochaetia bacterium]